MQNRVTLEGVVCNPKVSKTVEGTPYLRFARAVKIQGQEIKE